MRLALLRLASLRLGCLLLGLSAAIGAEEKKDDPVILLRSPFALIAGQTNQVKLRGDRLAAVTNVLCSAPGARLSLGKAADSKPPDGVDAKTGGSQRLELSLFLPPDLAGSTVTVIALSTNQSRFTNAFAVLPPTTVEEHEPNGGFRAAQPIPLPCVVRGSIDPKKDVDVYRVELSGPVHIEIEAQRSGSILDSILTVCGAGGTSLASNDDAAGRDSALDFHPPRPGAYFIVVQDAHDRGGETHPYLLKLTTGSSR